MKKILVGFMLGIMVVAVASVSPGQKITSNLINKILDIKVSTGENTYHILVNADGTINNTNLPSGHGVTVVALTGNEDGIYNIDFSSLNLVNTPTFHVTSHSGNINLATSGSAQYELTNTSARILSRKNDNSSYIRGKFSITMGLLGSDYKSMKTIRTIITELFPNYF